MSNRNISERVMKWMKLLLNKPYIPAELADTKGPLLLHISDTPQEIYPYIIKFVQMLQPSYIVHTGDLVDNIKLGILPHRTKEYRNSLKELLPKLESSCSATIYYVMGNHDRLDIVKKITIRGIATGEDYIDVEGVKFYVNHYYGCSNGRDFDYYLYGHSMEPISYNNGRRVFLNGLNSMNVINLSTNRGFNLPYPLETNTFRTMRRRKIGL